MLYRMPLFLYIVFHYNQPHTVQYVPSLVHPHERVGQGHHVNVSFFQVFEERVRFPEFFGQLKNSIKFELCKIESNVILGQFVLIKTR